MSSMTELVPLSNSQLRPQYSVVDERQNQHYSKYQAWSPEPSHIPSERPSNSQETLGQSIKKHLTTKLVMGIFVGLIICGIPLAVMSSLYVQKKNSSNSNTGSASSNSGSSTNLPSQCSTYTTNSDPTRLTSFTGCKGCFYDTSTYFPVGWYRFIGTGGTQLVTTPPNTGSCGASYPAWYNGTFPSTSGSTISSTVCVHVPGTLCSSSYPITISITNCNGYYVFYLPSATNTLIRYCTTL